MTFIILFACSILGIFGLFAIKSRELRRGALYAPSLREKGDALLETAIIAFVRACRHFNREMLRRGVALGLIHGKRHAVFFGALLRARYAKVTDRIRGKREFVNNGLASHFLKQVSEYKNSKGVHKKEEATDF